MGGVRRGDFRGFNKRTRLIVIDDIIIKRGYEGYSWLSVPLSHLLPLLGSEGIKADQKYLPIIQIPEGTPVVIIRNDEDLINVGNDGLLARLFHHNVDDAVD